MSPSFNRREDRLQTDRRCWVEKDISSLPVKRNISRSLQSLAVRRGANVKIMLILGKWFTEGGGLGGLSIVRFSSDSEFYVLFEIRGM